MNKLALDIGKEFWLSPNKSVADTYDSPGILISLIIKNLYVIAGIVLFFFIIAGGLGIILNAGNSEKQSEGSKTISSAVAGFFILFASYWIIKIIDVLTGLQILNPSI